MELANQAYINFNSVRLEAAIAVINYNNPQLTQQNVGVD